MRGRRPSFRTGLYAGVLMLLYSARREPSILIWYVGFPLILLVIAKYIFIGGAPQLLPVGLYPGDGELAGVVEGLGGFEAKGYSDLEMLYRDLERGRIYIAIVSRGDSVEVLYAGEEWRGLAISLGEALAFSKLYGTPAPPGAVEEAVKAVLGLAGVRLVEVDAQEWGPGKSLALYTINLMGVEALYVGLYGGMVTIVSFRRDGTLKILAGSPGGARSLLGFLTGFNTATIAFTWAAIIAGSLLLGADFSGASPSGAGVALLLLLLGLEAVFLASIPLSLVVRRDETAAAIAGIGGFLLIFGTGLAVPREMLPDLLAQAALAFPLTLAVELGRQALFGDIPPTEALAASWPLLPILLGAGLLGFYSYKRLISRAIEE